MSFFVSDKMDFVNKTKPYPKVLIVDDDDSFFNLLRNRLSKDCIIIWAKDGEDGITKALEKEPDIIVTDIMMPKANGFEVIRRLKSHQETAAIDFVILSSYGESRMVYEQKFLDSLGIRKYLIKSNHTPAEIAKEIKQLLK